MFEKAEIDGHHGAAYVSDSLVDFWYDCIEGYLSGCLRPCGLDTFADKVFVVKLEDLAGRPVLLLHHLGRLGLGRKTGVSEFYAIEESLPDSNRNRRSILASPASKHNDDACQVAISFANGSAMGGSCGEAIRVVPRRNAVARCECV